jgi:hypothetical protein
MAAIFPEHFQSFTVAFKNHLKQLFCAKPYQLFVEAEAKTNTNVPAKKLREATRAVIVSRLCAALKEIMHHEDIKKSPV